MSKKTYVIIIAITSFLIFSSGCTNSNNSIATISVNTDSEYANTFEALQLGILFDFDFKLAKVDEVNERWVHMWVECYQEGEKQLQSIVNLSSGLSLDDMEEGNMGFGILNPNTEAASIILYTPNVSTAKDIETLSFEGVFSNWDYAIGDGNVELQLNEPYTLAFYRQTSNNSIRSYDLANDNDIDQMINDDDVVFLLKIKIVDEF